MGFRFVRVTDYYYQYLQGYYERFPNVGNLSYEDQYKALTSDSIEIVSSYTRNLRILGVDAFDIVSNATPLQNAWKRENGLSPDVSKQELIIQQLKKIKPDVVWIDDFSLITGTWKAQLLKEVPTIRLLLGHICAPYNSVMEQKFKLFDIMFTCIPCFHRDLTNSGIRSELLYHGFESSILDRVEINNPFENVGFLFSGSLYTGSGFHKTRIEYVERMLDSGIDMDLYCNLETWKKVMVKKVMYTILTGLRKYNLEAVIEKVPVLKKNKGYGAVPIKYYSPKLIASSKPPVFGMDMYKLLSRSKICFNIHGEVADKCAGNIRLFEATGTGTCLVTDYKENITDLFIPDKEIITYTSVQDCIEKVKWLIANPAQRESIAKAGQARTLKDHTIAKRSEKLKEIITSALKSDSSSK